MSTEIIKTGWLKDKEGNKFAPKTLSSQVQTVDGVLLEDKLQEDLNAAKTEILDSVIENIDLSVYETKEDAQNKLAEAKVYVDEQITNHKYSYNDLKDRPFYADEQVWADWSDDVEGLEPILDGVFCLISEQPITPEIIEESVFSVTVPDVGVVELSSEVKENGVITLGQYGDTVFCSVHTTDLAEMLGVPIGVYVNAEMAMFITQLISNRIKQIDYRVLPSATLTKKGAVSLADIIDKIVDYNDFFELSDSTAYRDAIEGLFGRTLFNLISYNGASYFCYYKTEIGNYGNSNSAAYTKINLYCIDYRNSELKTILLTFPYEPADDDTPTSIELLP